MVEWVDMVDMRTIESCYEFAEKNDWCVALKLGGFKSGAMPN
jgi:hypothetical protein